MKDEYMTDYKISSDYGAYFVDICSNVASVCK